MSDQPDTKERILNAAEALFAEHGFTHTSTRRITRTANVNLAAVNYHFGSKDQLIKAVFNRRIKPVNGERLRRLSAWKSRAIPRWNRFWRRSSRRCWSLATVTSRRGICSFV